MNYKWDPEKETRKSTTKCFNTETWVIVKRDNEEYLWDHISMSGDTTLISVCRVSEFLRIEEELIAEKEKSREKISLLITLNILALIILSLYSISALKGWEKKPRTVSYGSTCNFTNDCNVLSGRKINSTDTEKIDGVKTWK